ncbi:MAG: response regulator [Leadbetterella sp.]|nr:response regulator [Leadbetterella sp.]
MKRSLRILVVEDQVFTSESIKETLQSDGHEVVAIARTYNEALVAAVKFKPEVIIMDIELQSPAEDGIRTAADIRNVLQAPVIFLTGKEDTESFKRAAEVRPEGYLLKPFKPRDLLNQVDLAYSRFSRNEPAPDDVFVWDNGSHIRVRRNDVIFMEAKRVFTAIYRIHEPDPLMVTMNLGHISRHFPEPYFFRLSKSLLINLNFLQKVKDNELFFEGIKKALSISDSKKAELKKQLTIIRSPRTGKTDD